MDPFLEKVRVAMSELARVMARLRAPGGCPWDREQTLESLKPYLIEEAYEVLEAIESGSVDGHCEELGDVLMQVVFQAEVRREGAHFDLADVASAICRKLIRRHPHVFGDTHAKDSADVLQNWEALKKKEKGGRGALSGVPRALPGLIRATRMGEKAAHTGFDFESAAQAFGKVKEEIKEIEEATDPAHKRAEIGDALFALCNYARKEGIDAEEALREALDRFGSRFARVEAAAGDQMKQLSAAQLQALWQDAKAATKLSTKTAG